MKVYIMCECVYVYVFLSVYISVYIPTNNSYSSFSKFSLIPFYPESWSNTVKYRPIMARIFFDMSKTAQHWWDRGSLAPISGLLWLLDNTFPTRIASLINCPMDHIFCSLHNWTCGEVFFLLLWLLWGLWIWDKLSKTTEIWQNKRWYGKSSLGLTGSLWVTNSQSWYPDTAMVWTRTLTMKTGYMQSQRGSWEAQLL